MDKKFIKNISASTLGAIINQLFGLLIFYILSNHLSKDEFGELNWSLAVFLTLFNILACGIDQVLVKKIAGNENMEANVSIYLNHVLVTGVFFYGSVLLAERLIPGLRHSFFEEHYAILYIGFSKLMIYFSTPFKQLATGLRKFKILLYMTIVSNVVKGGALTLSLVTGNIEFSDVLYFFIIGDLLEFLCCIFLAWRFLPRFKAGYIKWRDYILLLKESLPQLGVVIFNSALARFDWILVGSLVSVESLGDYSFTYKVFEVSTLPLLSLAPLLIPIFTIYFRGETKNTGNLNDFLFLFRLEMIVAGFVAMMLNVCWTPFIDAITAGKYGAVNANTIFILSLSMPFLYLNNFLWTIHFAKGHLRMILFVFIIAFAVNLTGDLVLIPYLKNNGAAIAYLIAIATQSFLYLRKSQFLPLSRVYAPLLLCSAAAFGSWYITYLFISNIYVSIAVAITSYTVLLFLLGQLRKKDGLRFRRLIHL